MRESITIINDNKTAIIHIQEKGTKINKLSFEVRSVVTNELLLSDSIAALENSDEGKKVTLKLDTPFDVSTEYALKITLVTDVSKKIHYYTRLKYYSDRCFLEEKLAFVKEFHDMTINKSTEVATYIEPNAQKEDSSFAFVDINSSFETITWGELKPVVITDIIPTVKEINIESGAIELAYYRAGIGVLKLSNSSARCWTEPHPFHCSTDQYFTPF